MLVIGIRVWHVVPAMARNRFVGQEQTALLTLHLIIPLVSQSGITLFYSSLKAGTYPRQSKLVEISKRPAGYVHVSYDMQPVTVSWHNVR